MTTPTTPIKTWQERMGPGYIDGGADLPEEVAMKAEIAELRAALAQRAGAADKPVAQEIAVCGCGLDMSVCIATSCGKGIQLVTASADAAPAGAVAELTDDQCRQYRAKHGNGFELLRAVWRDALKSPAPAGYVLMPIDPPDSIIAAIEAEVDSQLVASGIEPSSMHRQDGDHIYRAAITAAMNAEKREKRGGK